MNRSSFFDSVSVSRKWGQPIFLKLVEINFEEKKYGADQHGRVPDFAARPKRREQSVDFPAKWTDGHSAHLGPGLTSKQDNLTAR